MVKSGRASLLQSASQIPRVSALGLIGLSKRQRSVPRVRWEWEPTQGRQF
jgi:hypothetical protein